MTLDGFLTGPFKVRVTCGWPARVRSGGLPPGRPGTHHPPRPQTVGYRLAAGERDQAREDNAATWLTLDCVPGYPERLQLPAKTRPFRSQILRVARSSWQGPRGVEDEDDGEPDGEDMGCHL